MGVAVVERLRPFGYVGAASGRLGLSGRLSALHFANWHPDWRAQYEKNGYLRIDPVPNWAAACGVPIGVAELRSRLPPKHPANEVLKAAEKYGYFGGLIVPQRAADNELGAVAYVAGRDPADAEERFALRALAGALFDRGEALAGRSPNEVLPKTPPEITARERECLQHLIEGRSTAHTAKAMGVSEATVRFHARNLRDKTGASNRARLTAVAIAYAMAPRV